MSDQPRERAECTALICVDVQRDFLPGGALAVPDGDAVVQPLLEMARGVDLVVASRDFHPAGHCSFIAAGGSWPEHCVAGTPGAEIDDRIDNIADVIVSKGRDRGIDAYSAFDGTGLAEILRSRGVTHAVIGGLATDYCVRATALDAVKAGFATTVVRAAIRAVDVERDDGERAIRAMEDAGVTMTETWSPARAATETRR